MSAQEALLPSGNTMASSASVARALKFSVLAYFLGQLLGYQGVKCGYKPFS